MKVSFKQLLAEALPDAKEIAKSGIHIDPSKKGTFTRAAKSHGKSVQSFANQVLSNKGSFSPAMRKKANFAKNASKWHHAEYGLEGFGDNGLTIDTDKIPLPQHGSITDSTLVNPIVNQSADMQQRKPVSNLSSEIAGGLSLIDSLIPPERDRRYYVEPQEVYNQHPYGTGSSALMDNGGLIRTGRDYIPDFPVENMKGKKGKKTKGGGIITDMKPHIDFLDAGGIIPDGMSAFQPTQQPTQQAPSASPLGTKLNKDQQKKYDVWKTQLPKALQYEGDYDLKGLWLSNPNVKPSSNLHFPDTYKLPNHPTFSNESKYFSPQTRDRAGHWQETDSSWNYIPFNTAVKDTVVEKKMAMGGQLSSDKAKQILTDGTANGKKLTGKQKRYMGWVAGGGQAYFGATTGGGDGDPTVDGGNPQSGGKSAGYFVDPKLGAYDAFNYALGTGVSPNNLVGIDKRKINLFQQLQPLGEDNARRLVTAAQIASQNPDYKGLTPEQRIQKYYDSNSSDSTIQSLKNKVKTYSGTGNAQSMYQTSPDVNLLSQQGVNTSATPYAKAFDKGGTLAYDNGGDIQTHWGGDAQQISENPYDGGTVRFSGDSHEQGGIGMTYNGKGVEVEGDETAVRSPDGTLNIMGNMNIPGSNMKFKTLSKKIANKEAKYTALKNDGTEIVNNTDTGNKFDRLKFNAGMVMMKGGDMGQQDLAKKKEQLSFLQKAILDTADEHGLDPLHLSKGNMRKAKKGTYIKADAGFSLDDGEGSGGDPTVSDRHNNPGNIKYSPFAKKYGAVQGEKSKDGDYFAKFPDKATGEKAMRDLFTTGKPYQGKTVAEGIDTWTNHKPYNYDLGDIAKKKISDLSPTELDTVFSTMRKGEGTTYGTAKSEIPAKAPTPGYIPMNTEKFSMGNLDFANPVPPTYTKVAPPELTGDLSTQGPSRPMDTNAEGLNPLQVLPELYGAATNRREPVKAQQFTPQLFQPYQVSFADRLEGNQSALSAGLRATAGNPAAAGTIAAQMYAANNAVGAEEFRTNQGISEDVMNKNVNLLNQAEQQNLGIRDQQYVRQEQAKSKTKEQNQLILNSISNKYLQNSLQNKTLQAYENLYDYRFDKNGKAQYEGGDASFNWPTPGGRPTGSLIPYDPTDTRRVESDAQGNVKKVTNRYASPLEVQQKELNIEKNAQKLPFLRKLFDKY